MRPQRNLAGGNGTQEMRAGMRQIADSASKSLNRLLNIAPMMECRQFATYQGDRLPVSPNTSPANRNPAGRLSGLTVLAKSLLGAGNYPRCKRCASAREG